MTIAIEDIGTPKDGETRISTIQERTGQSNRAQPVNVQLGRMHNSIPESIRNDRRLNDAIKARLPAHYNFELHKTIHMIRQHAVKRVALQMPEGLQMFATTICEILEEFAWCPNEQQQRKDQENVLSTVILADVTYGACCIDDFTARALGCDLLVHYGHSCLVPITTTKIRTLYVFVDISFQLQHLLDSMALNFPPESTGKIVMVATIQFSSSLPTLRQVMLEQMGYKQVEIPQIRPLSPGEVLGCTAPRLPKDTELVLYLGDGRFHLESIMIANQHLADRFYRYDPYGAEFTHERYAYEEMYALRRDAIEQARLPTSKVFGVIFGTLGRQGSQTVLQWIRQRLEQRGKQCVVVLLSEISRDKLAKFAGTIDIWIQTSCPRLSIDWGYSFDRPLLTPYEAMVALMDDEEWKKSKPDWMGGLPSDKSCCGSDSGCESAKSKCYPMDFYAKNSLGPWTPNHIDPVLEAKEKEERRQKLKAMRNR